MLELGDIAFANELYTEITKVCDLEDHQPWVKVHITKASTMAPPSVALPTTIHLDHRRQWAEDPTLEDRRTIREMRVLTCRRTSELRLYLALRDQRPRRFYKTISAADATLATLLKV